MSKKDNDILDILCALAMKEHKNICPEWRYIPLKPKKTPMVPNSTKSNPATLFMT